MFKRFKKGGNPTSPSLASSTASSISDVSITTSTMALETDTGKKPRSPKVLSTTDTETSEKSTSTSLPRSTKSESDPPSPIKHSRSTSVSPKDSTHPLHMPNRKFAAKLNIARNEFKPRSSKLDPETIMRDDHSNFFGFFTMFWVGSAIYVFMSVYRNWSQSGLPVRLYLFTVFSQDAVNLAISDAVMVTSTFAIVLLQKLVVKGWINDKIGYVLHHLWQACWFATWIYWVVYKDWPWVQSGFFALHSMTMLMKQHSYNDYNRELLLKSRHLSKLKSKRDELLKHKEDISEEDTKKLVEWESDIKDLESELKPSEFNQFPNNVTFGNYLDYLFVPSLVYELEYPRTEKIRWNWLAFRIVSIFSAFVILYITVEEYIFPVLQEMHTITFAESLVQLLMPFMVLYLLIFFIIFEGILNAFAELTRFADRQFYDDWWNSTNWDEYARKWNRPVHEFLLRHVYVESIRSYKVSKKSATYITFLLSACLHELVMAVIGKRLRFYLFFLQMSQIPLIMLGRTKWMRRHKVIGNTVFWFGMFVGPPLLAVAYCREHYMRQ